MPGGPSSGVIGVEVVLWVGCWVVEGVVNEGVTMMGRVDDDISAHGRPRGQDFPSTWMSVDKVRSMQITTVLENTAHISHTYSSYASTIGGRNHADTASMPRSVKEGSPSFALILKDAGSANLNCILLLLQLNVVDVGAIRLPWRVFRLGVTLRITEVLFS